VTAVRNKSVVMLLAASVALLLVAAALARCGDERVGGVTAPVVKQVEFPRERAAREQRQQRAAQVAGGKAPTAPATSPSTDRLTRALSSPSKNGAVVFEVNALRHSPLVDAIINCRRQQGGDEMHGLDLMKSELGIDLTEDVDRVAVDAEVLAVSGFFSKMQLPAELGEGEVYGDAGRIFTLEGDKGEPAYMAKVGDDLVMTSTDPVQLKAAIDRAEGRSEAPSSFPAGVVGGEIYGMVGPGLLGQLVQMGGASELAGLSQMLTTSQVRMSVDDAAALSLDIGTKSPEDGSELAKALGGAVAMARAEALSSGRADLAGMLEQARVEARPDGSIAFDLAVPGNDLLKAMGCPPLSSSPSPTPSPTPTTP
jgi:hypothetical protein